MKPVVRFFAALTIALFSCIPVSAAQQLFNENMTSPDVWRPSSPGEPGIDAKGDLNLSIPVMTVPGRNGLDYQISFNYTSGIRVHQRASWIGLGWSWDPGSITREPMGLIEWDGMTATATGVDWAEGTGVDWQPDAYYVTLPVGSSMMTRDQDSTWSAPPGREMTGDHRFYLNKWRPWKIEPDVNADSVIVDTNYYTSSYFDGITEGKPDYEGFTITTDDGTRYIFGAPTLSTFRTFGPSSTQNMMTQYYVNTWRLQYILGPDYIEGSLPDNGDEPGSWIRFTYSDPTTMEDASFPSTIQQVAYLERIDTPTHVALIDTQARTGENFNDWEDSYEKLQKIRLYARHDMNTVVKTVEPRLNPRHLSVDLKRLALDSLRVTGVEDTLGMPWHEFTYYSPMSSVTSDRIDFFGYYNDDVSKNFNDNGSAKAWSLKKITYPTGGSREFDYANDQIDSTEDLDYFLFQLNPSSTSNNTYQFTSGKYYQGGVRLTSIVTDDGMGEDWETTYTYPGSGGVVSGVPVGAWVEEFTNIGNFYSATERGHAAVYYDHIVKVDPDGGKTFTYYTTDDYDHVEQIGTVIYLYGSNGSKGGTVVTGNQDWSWGIPWKTEFVNATGSSNPVKKVIRDLALSSPILAKAFDFGNNGYADVVWGFPHMVDRITATTYPEDGSQTNSAVSMTEYTYDFAGSDMTGYATLKREWLAGIDRRIKRFSYAHEAYSGMDDLNILNPVVRTIVEDSIGGSNTLRSATIATWKEFTPVDTDMWRPWYRASWIGSLGSNPASFSSWTSANPGANWQIKNEYTDYDVHGSPLGMEDGRGVETEYTYHDTWPIGYLESVSKESLTKQFDYNTYFVGIESIADENGNVEEYYYDHQGRLLAVKDRLGHTVKEVEYDTTSVPFSVTVRDYHDTGGSDYYETITFYDGLSRPIQTQNKQNASTSYVVSHMEYIAGTGSSGEKIRQWKPFTRSTGGDYLSSYSTYAHSEYGGGTDPFVETLFRRDGLGRVETVTPENDGVSVPYIETEYLVDELEGGSSVEYVIEEITDEEDHITRTYKDAFGRTKQLVNGYDTADETVTTFAYNGLDLVTTVTDPRDLEIEYTYDPQGQLIERDSPDAGIAKYLYDEDGRLRFSQDANQEDAGTVFFQSYDAVGRPKYAGVASATFSSLDGGATSGFESTTSNWLSVNHYGDSANEYAGTGAKPSTGSVPWSVFSSPIGSVSAGDISNSVNHRTANAFKSNGRWQAVLWGYDDKERIARKFVFAEDSVGGVFSTLDTSIEYTYNWQDQITELNYDVDGDDFNLWYDYNIRGLPTDVYASTTGSKPGLADVSFDYYSTGSIFRTRLKEYGSGLYRVNQSREYNLREWVTQIGDYGQTTPFTGTYTYFDDGNVETAAFNQIDAPSPDHFKFNLSYDPIHRLTSGNYYSGYWDIDCDSGAFQARGGSKRKKPLQSGGGVLLAEEGCWLYSSSNNYDISGITYDDASNILTLNRNNASGTEIDDLAYTISGTSNRMTAIADDHDSTTETWDAEDGSFTYDDNGNIETMGAPYSITATSYDHRNLALSMTISGTSTNYRYDESGQRFAKKEGMSNGEHYVLDGAATVGVFSDSGTLDYWNITLGGMVLGRVDANGDRFYYEPDAYSETAIHTPVCWPSVNPVNSLRKPHGSTYAVRAAWKSFEIGFVCSPAITTRASTIRFRSATTGSE